MVEASGLRSETLKVSSVAGGREHRQRAAMKGAAERDDPLPLRPARYIMIATRNFDRGLARFGARVAEEDALGKRQPRQLLSDRLLTFDTIEI